jgi:hypothetical protein
MALPEFYLPHVNKNRVMCDVLYEMRECVKTMNFAPMLSLIEEVQIMANRMEAGLDDKRNYYECAKVLREKLKEIKEGYIVKEEEKNDE